MSVHQYVISDYYYLGVDDDAIQMPVYDVFVEKQKVLIGVPYDEAVAYLDQHVAYEDFVTDHAENITMSGLNFIYTRERLRCEEQAESVPEKYRSYVVSYPYLVINGQKNREVVHDLFCRHEMVLKAKKFQDILSYVAVHLIPGDTLLFLEGEQTFGHQGMVDEFILQEEKRRRIEK